MTENELKDFLLDFTRDPMVLSHVEHAVGHFVYKVYAKKDKSKTASLEIMYREDGYIVINSPLGELPREAQKLERLLEFNLEPVYSKIASHEGELYEIFISHLEQLTQAELINALWEVAVLAAVFQERINH